MEQDKIEVQKQWDTNPCGAEAVTYTGQDLKKYFQDIRSSRYKDYAPWMQKAVDFTQYTNKKILEIGVGMGSDHWSFAINENSMTALDLSREHLRQTQEHLSTHNLKGYFVHGDAENMPFVDKSFDLVYTFGAIHHTPNTQKAIDEIHRVLSPDGKAIIGVYHRNSIFFWIATVLCRGVLRGQLFLKNWRHFMSEIEYRTKESTARPLVKTYTRKQVTKMCSQFSQVNIESYHVEASHFSFFKLLLPQNWTREFYEKIFSRFGWYLIIKAKK